MSQYDFIQQHYTFWKNFYVLLMYLLSFTLIIGVSVFLSIKACGAEQQQPYCEKCARLEKSIINILYVVEEHDPDFVLDVLSERDEWYILEELIGPIPPVIIKDSTYRRMRNVFPDLPARQAKPDTLCHVKSIKLVN